MKRLKPRRPDRLNSLLIFELPVIATILAVIVVLGGGGFYIAHSATGGDREFAIAIFGACLLAAVVVLALFSRSEFLGALVEADKRAHRQYAGLALIMDARKRILVCHQTSRHDAWAGMWLPPGGYKSSTETSTQLTAIRRARELVDDRNWTSHGKLASTDNSRAYHKAVRRAGSEPIHDELYFLSCDSGDPLCADPDAFVSARAVWIGKEDLDDLPTPPHFRTLLEFFLSVHPHLPAPKYWKLDDGLYDQLRHALGHGEGNGV
jgi:NUDIX domain